MFNQCWVLELYVVIEFIWKLAQAAKNVILYYVKKLYIFKLIEVYKPDMAY
jgi:hypothetical protein